MFGAALRVALDRGWHFDQDRREVRAPRIADLDTEPAGSTVHVDASSCGLGGGARVRSASSPGPDGSLRQGGAGGSWSQDGDRDPEHYGHLWPDDAGLTRRAVDEVLGPCVAAQQVI
jgi:hypothetical protein